MPLVKVYLRKGKSPEYLGLLSDAVHAALVDEAGIPEDDRFHVITELNEGTMYADPSYGGVSRTEDLTIIEITLNEGRSVDQKKGIYKRITRNLEQALDLRPDDVLISLVEVTPENWSFGHGIATYA